MIRKGLVVIVSGVILWGLTHQAIATEPARNSTDTASTELFVTSELAAAFVAAYEDCKQIAASQNDTCSASDLVKRYSAVGARMEGDNAVIVFFPKSPVGIGGGVKFIVDPKALTVRSREFSR